ncbi:hypothetical protein D3C81_1303420 [compost metagenome]
MPGPVTVTDAHDLRHVEYVLLMLVGDPDRHADMGTQACLLVEGVKRPGDIFVGIGVLDPGNAKAVGQCNGVLRGLKVLRIAPVRQFAFDVAIGFQQNAGEFARRRVLLKAAAFRRLGIGVDVQQPHGFGVGPDVVAGVIGQQEGFICGNRIQPSAR